MLASENNSRDRVLPFTGWESDRFIRFANSLKQQGVVGRVRIIGREPITTTRVDFEGLVVDTINDGYKRLLVVESMGGATYLVGGSNSTLPIAAETVLFFDLPDGLVGPRRTDADLSDLLAALKSVGSASTQVAEIIKHNIRLGHFSTEAKSGIARTLRELLPTAAFSLKREIVEILGLVETQEVLEPLLVLLRDESPEIRADVALRFRGLERVIKSVGEESELGSQCIQALCLALDDPEPKVRIYAAEDLGYFYNDAAIQKMQQCLLHDTHDHVRWACVIALGRTNRKDIAALLASVLETDQSIYVQQGAMLGLGRLGERVLNSSPDLITRVVTGLRSKLTDGHDATDHPKWPVGELQDYAAYLVGELGKNSLSLIDPLIDCLRPDRNFRVKSNTVLSLSKLLDHYYDDSSRIARIESHLRENLELSRPDSWPSSAFFGWFLVGAAELAALLELHLLSSIYYERASKEFNSSQWMSCYYDAIGRYERAEHMCAFGELTGAIREIEKTIQLLDLVQTMKEFQQQSDKASSGLQFKLTLAKARHSLLQAAETWGLVVLTPIQQQTVRDCFDKAFEQYNHIDVLGISDDSKKLSRSETDLIISLKSLADLGRQMLDLKSLVENLDSERLGLAFGRVRSNIRSLKRLSGSTRSRTLVEAAQILTDLANRADEQRLRGLPLTEVIEDFLSDCRPVFGGSLPTPGACPVINFGNATMSARLRGSIAGDGTQSQPFIFPSKTRLVFEFNVTVIKRTKNDRLVFEAIDPPPGARERIQEVPVHEGVYTLRPVDFGESGPSMTATRYTFALSFQNQGCSQVAQLLDLWIRVFDREREFLNPKEKMKTRMESLKVQIADLTEKQRALREVHKQYEGELPPFGLQQQLRELEVVLSTRKAELARLIDDWEAFL